MDSRKRTRRRIIEQDRHKPLSCEHKPAQQRNGNHRHEVNVGASHNRQLVADNNKSSISNSSISNNNKDTLPELRMMSPLFRTAALLLVALVGVDASKVASKSNMKAFQKAMKPSPKALRANNDARKQKIFTKLLANAEHRKLDQQNEMYEQFGFDVTQYSIKYTGCSSVMTYSDEMAEQEDVDTVLENKRFVIFRMCPSKYCNKYSVNGCSYDYGEYLIAMDDYLEAYSEYMEQKQEDFCEYCRPCMEADEEAAQNDDGNGGRRLNDAQEEEEGEQCDEDVCQDYSMCVEDEEVDDDAARQQQEQENIEIREFFECMAVEYGDDDANDQQYYIAPHCGSDGYTISIGVYADETCSTWIGDSMSVEDVLGFEPDFSEIENYFPQECLSCLEVVSCIVSCRAHVLLRAVGRQVLCTLSIVVWLVPVAVVSVSVAFLVVVVCMINSTNCRRLYPISPKCDNHRLA